MTPLESEPNASSTRPRSTLSELPVENRASRVEADRQCDALIIVPPFVRSSSGPSLGPAMLAGAARAAGFPTEVVDLAITAIIDAVPALQLAEPSGLAGDHDKNETALTEAQNEFFREVAEGTGLAAKTLRTCKLEWDEVDRAVDALLETGWARRVALLLRKAREPRVVGVSVMFAEQVLAALVVTRLVRAQWPKARLVWGGAHVTALAPEIASDARYGRGVDGFVMGYAEQTFVELLGAIRSGAAWPAEIFRAGYRRHERARGDLLATPFFSDLEAYGSPRLTLPAQVTRGCAYGRCGFCTYPHVEGMYTEPPAETGLAHIESVVSLAHETGAVVSFKDALMTAPYLRAVAELIGGRVRWSACTKLTPGLADLLPVLSRSGCETLEIGLETLVSESQLLVDKKSSRQTLVAFLAAAHGAGVRVVVNYMTGLPFEDPTHAAKELAWVRDLAARNHAVVEHHAFELERRAPLAASLSAARTWPWSSVVEWRLATCQEEAA